METNTQEFNATHVASYGQEQNDNASECVQECNSANEFTNSDAGQENTAGPVEETSNGASDMLYGALWCIGGIIVTAASYSAVKDTGGTYIITWGAIVFGGYQFLKGLFNSIA